MPAPGILRDLLALRRRPCPKRCWPEVPELVFYSEGGANPELTLRVYPHAMREEETDLSFLDFGSTKRHPRGTKRVATAGTKTPRHATPRRGLVFLEHETGFEPATPTLATWRSTS